MLNISPKQLRQAADLQEKIEALQTELAAILGSGSNNSTPAQAPQPKKKGMSAAGRARIAAAQKARWAKVKGGTEKTIKALVAAAKPAKKRKKISAEGLARIKAAQKLRWAKVKGKEGKTVAETVIEAVVSATKLAKRTRKLSAAAKAAMSAAAKARWAKAKAAGKMTL